MRNKLSFSAIRAVVLTLLLAAALALPAGAQTYNEAPELAAKVAAGELPPVEERLPKNPLVIEPLESIGKYGGTWRRVANDQNWNYIKMMQYGFSLLRYVDDGLDIIPGLAESYSHNEDRSVWTITLREGVKWSDGHPVTVDDILFWWNDMVLHPDHPEVVPDFGQVEGELAKLVKVDDYTLRFEFVAPAPIHDARLAIWPSGSDQGPRTIVPAHYLKQFHPDYSDYPDFEVFDEKLEWWTNPEYPVLNPWMPVEYRAGDRLILERNPYYYAVDTEGNQLPYIDRIEARYVADLEVVKLEVMNGNVDMQLRPYIDLRELSLLRQNEANGGYRTLLWDSGSGSGPLYYPNQNHPDPEKAEIYRNRDFRRALSHAINRDRIQRLVYFGLGEKTTGTFSPKAIEYHRTERGQQMYEQWRDLAVEYDPELAASLLDSIGVVDQDGDGWRDLPSGAELVLRIEQDANAGSDYIDVNNFVREDWEAIGLRTIINPVDGSQIQLMQQTATFDIRDSWELGDGPDHVVFPAWLVPIEHGRWAPLYGRWYSVRGTELENSQLDLDPRDRTPPRDRPPEGSPYDQLQKLYDKIKIEPDDIARDNLVLDAIQIHIDEGPFIIGTVADYPRPLIAKNNMRNVPDGDDLALGGFVNPWIMVYPAITNTETYYYE